jgi:hypothetical protein
MLTFYRLAEIEPRNRPTSILEDRSTSNHGPFLYKARAEELELSMDKQVLDTCERH